MCLTGSGKKKYHEWIKPPTAIKKKDNITEFLVDTMPHLKNDEIELYRTLNADEDIKRMAVDMGIDDKRIDEIFGKKKRKKK